MEKRKINNAPSYAKSKKWVVATKVCGDWWFWGASDDIDDCMRMCEEAPCRVTFRRTEVEL